MLGQIKLTGQYKEIYKQIKAEILANAEHNQSTRDAIKDIRDILFRAEKDNQPLDELFPDGLSLFCSSVVSSLPGIPVGKKYKGRKSKGRKLLILIVLFMIILTIFSEIHFDLFAYWRYGMWVLIGDVDNQSVTEIGLERGSSQPFTVTIDMNNLEKNIGQDLFVDENFRSDRKDCKITVGDIGFNEIDGKRVYWVSFYCYADYDLSHTIYYYPRLAPQGDENYLASSVIYNGQETIPIPIHGVGGGSKNYEVVVFDFLTVDPDSKIQDQEVTINFWVLDGFKYVRTGW